ncbi:MAG: plasmid replication protein [Alphaproteobacteria bacterium]|nr:plasmid replication protein [Alphaproteobacteria bacterium]
MGAKSSMVDRNGNLLGVHSQLELFGLERCIVALETAPGLSASQVRRDTHRFEAAARCMAEIDPNEIAFLHAGLCQTGLPHSKPGDDRDPWHRSNGRFHLVVEPGTIIDRLTGKPRHVGVPFGPKARLIFLHINTEGVKRRQILLGRSMSAWMRRLGLHVSGGDNGSIKPFKEQNLRIGRARFSFQFEHETADGRSGLGISDVQVADKLHLWVTDDEAEWSEEIELTEKFHEHLREHAVPLSDHAISYLSGSCLQLDFYAWAAWRLPRLTKPLRLNWAQVAATFSAAGEPKRLAERIRKEVLPEVYAVYRDMRVESVKGGLLLYPSKPPVPKPLVSISSASK